MQNTRGHLIIIVGPSGTGKSTLIKELKKEIPALKESVSFTTRGIRPGEVDGKHYHFITEAEFKQKIHDGDFLEYAYIHSHYSGTGLETVNQGLERGEQLLFDLDIQGADSFKKTFGEKAQVIFIEPPSLEELETRLKSRGTESQENFRIRVSNAAKELKRKSDYDYLVMNKNVPATVDALKEIVLAIMEK